MTNFEARIPAILASLAGEKNRTINGSRRQQLLPEVFVLMARGAEERCAVRRAVRDAENAAKREARRRQREVSATDVGVDMTQLADDFDDAEQSLEALELSARQRFIADCLLRGGTSREVATRCSVSRRRAQQLIAETERSVRLQLAAN